jgi:hypothetical protein
LEEALSAEHRGEVRPEDFERHVAIVLHVTGEIDRGHPTRPELALERVAVGEGGLQTSEQIGQAGAQAWDSSIIGLANERGQRVVRLASSIARAAPANITAKRQRVRIPKGLRSTPRIASPRSPESVAASRV